MDQTVTRFRNSASSKTFGRRVLTGSLLGLAVGALSASWSVQAGIVPEHVIWLAPVLANPAEDPPEQTEDLSSQESRAISQLMYRDRDRERLLFHAQDQLMEGRLSTGLEYLQRILDFEEDLFIWRKSDQKLVSLKSEADRLLTALDGSSFARYQQMVDADAGTLYKHAASLEDPYLFEEVARRYFHTIHGFKATDWCATRWFDHGHFELAARAWESLENHPDHRSRVTKSMQTKRALAAKWSRKPSPEPQPLIRVAANHDLSANTTRLDVIPASASETAAPLRSAWTSFQGGSTRAESVAATTPFLNPDWIVSYGDDASPTIKTAFSLWEEKQEKSLRPLATGLFPIVVDDNVLFRDFQGIRCVDRITGAVKWSYRCRTSLEAEMHELDEKHGTDGVRSSRSGTYVQTQAAYAANSVLGLLSSDGERVYAVDEMVLNPASHGSSSSNRASNLLVALPIHPRANGAVSPVWTAGGTEDSRTGEPALVGHFFRGPPLPIDGRLFAVTECRGQLNLVALDAETGKLLWKQGISFADDTSDADQNRYPLACPIAFGTGVLVCPTQTGLLVGVDAMTGTLLWSYCYAEDLYQNENQGWRDRFRRTFGSEGYPSAPKVHGRNVLLLPRQSSEIHCLDIETGERLWTAPREDGEYIGAVTSELVFVVGQRYSRGLGLSSGEEFWSARFGMPAGQGIHAGSQYLLPLESGRIATIDLATGSEIGLSGWRNSKHNADLTGGEFSDLTSRLGLAANPLPENWHTGNLIPAGDRILAAGPAGLIAFPQTGELLNRTVRNRLLESPNDLSTRLLAAELQLNLGQWGPARQNLETVLAPEASERLRPQGEFLLKELLFRQLETEPNFAQPLLDELAALVSTPADRGRFLMRKADYQLRAGNPLGAWGSAQALIELDYESVLPWPQNPQHVISPRNYAIRLMEIVRGQLRAEELAQVDHHVETTCQSVLAANRVKPMQQFLALYGEWPQSSAVRQRLASIAKSRGEFQRAEFYWLENRESEDPVVSAEAIYQLMQLWNQLGLDAEAAMLAEELASDRLRSVSLMNGRHAENVLAEISHESLLGQAIERRSPPGYRIDRVEIAEQRWTESSLDWTWETIEKDGREEEMLVNAYAQYRREFPLAPGSSFQLLDKGWVDEAGEHAQTRVAVVDRAAGVIRGKVRIPLRNTYPSLSKRAHVGHYFPVGGINSMAGVSLLELENEQPLWSTKLGEEAVHEHLLRTGPAGTDFAVFQGQQELLMVDPITGKTLWKRSDIDPSSGLVSDPYAGLFGDDDVLVLFNANRSSYTVFATGTGEDLYHGRLDIDTGQIRRIFGRKLFYITETENGRRMRIWDFGENRLIFDEPAGRRIFTALTPDHNLVVVIPPESDNEDDDDACEKSSRLQILDVAGDRKLLDLSIPADDLKNLNYIRAFEYNGTFYVNLQRSVQMPVERLFSYYASDAFPPVENIQGDLLAVDPKTGKVKWQRTLPQRSILQMPHVRLPFLVTISRVRDRWQGGKQGLLVEVLDAETGETIAQKDNNLSDRVVNLVYDREKGFLDLNGLKTRIRLKFGPAVKAIPDGDGPI